jgi:hypothetical protein
MRICTFLTRRAVDTVQAKLRTSLALMSINIHKKAGKAHNTFRIKRTNFTIGVIAGNTVLSKELEAGNTFGATSFGTRQAIVRAMHAFSEFLIIKVQRLARCDLSCIG